MAGGRDAGGGYLADTWVWDGAGWTQVAGLPGPLAGAKAVFDASRGVVVLFGGSPAGNQFANATLQWAGSLWSTLLTPAAPSPRWAHQMAYDPGRQAVLLFGGVDAYARLGDTWELAGSTWTQRFPAMSPPSKSSGQAVFDTRSGRVLLHSGDTTIEGVTSAPADVWLWDGDTWAEVSPVGQTGGRFQQVLFSTGSRTILWSGREGSPQPSDTWEWTGTDWLLLDGGPPSRRTGVAMAYDGPRDRHVVFGGRLELGGADSAETWELHEMAWLPRTPASSPSARSDAGLAYDSARQRTVLFGGRSGGPCGAELGDTWEWDGQDWSQRAPTHSPPAIGGIQLVFDSARHRTLALCGSEMWAYDGSDWARVSATRPSARGNFGCTWDATRQRMVMFGGSDNQAWLAETWEWDGVTWQLRASGHPSSRATLGMAYDPSRQLHFMLGGWNGSDRLGDAFTWDGTSWSSIPGLGARSDVALGYDPIAQRVLVAGGYSTSAGWLADTHAWTGSSWSQSASLPAPRHWNGIAFDPGRQRILMFGGGNQSTVFDDTWEFDGVGWTDVSPSTRPPARGGHRLVHDPHTGQILMHGGTNYLSSPVLEDTWTWDGATWTQRFAQHGPGKRYEYGLVSTGTTTLLVYGASFGRVHDDIWEWTGTDWQPREGMSPPPRSGYGASYDAHRDRVVVFGGREQCGAGAFLNDTWEWDGDSWQQRVPAHSPSPRERANLAFDATRGCSVLLGGVDQQQALADTWEWDGVDWRQAQPAATPPGGFGHGLSFDAQDEELVAFGPQGAWRYDAAPRLVASAGQDLSVNEFQGVELDGFGSSGPAGMTFAWEQVGGTLVLLTDADTARPTFTAPLVAIGGEILTFILTVRKDGFAASDAVNVTVVNVNHPPVAEAGLDQSVAEGAPVTLHGEASFDFDQDPFTWRWVQVGGTPTVSLTGSDTANPTFVAPTITGGGAPGVVATLVFALTVDDGFPPEAPAPGHDLADVTDLVTIEITNANNQPVADAAVDQTTNENEPVALDGTGSADPDGDVLTYSWIQTGGPPVALLGSDTATPALTAPFVGAGGADLTFLLTVSDGFGGLANDTVVVHVRNANEPPACDGARPSEEELWPPDGKMVPIRIRGVVDPDANVVITITGVWQDEPTSGCGHGDTPVDAVIQAGGRVLLRAERSGSGNGRVYHVHFTATDVEGSCSGVVKVSVPKNKKSAVIDGGPLYRSTN